MCLSKIAANLSANCAIVPGAKVAKIWVGNVDEFDVATAAAGVVTELEPATVGNKVYYVEGAGDSVTFEATKVENTYMYSHTLSARAMSYAAAVLDTVNQMGKGGRFFVIAEMNTGDFMLFGIGAVGATTSKVGMECAPSFSATIAGRTLAFASPTQPVQLGECSLPPLFNPVGGAAAWIATNVAA